MSARVELDCSRMGLHNGQDLLELCMAQDASDYLADKVSPSEENANSGSDSDEEKVRLPSITISV